MKDDEDLQNQLNRDLETYARKASTPTISQSPSSRVWTTPGRTGITLLIPRVTLNDSVTSLREEREGDFSNGEESLPEGGDEEEDRRKATSDWVTEVEQQEEQTKTFNREGIPIVPKEDLRGH